MTVARAPKLLGLLLSPLALFLAACSSAPEPLAVRTRWVFLERVDSSAPPVLSYRWGDGPRVEVSHATAVHGLDSRGDDATETLLKDALTRAHEAGLTLTVYEHDGFAVTPGRLARHSVRLRGVAVSALLDGKAVVVDDSGSSFEAVRVRETDYEGYGYAVVTLPDGRRVARQRLWVARARSEGP